MLAATDDNFIFESVKQELSKLPLSALGSVLAFYNANGLFLESYKRQATDLFAKSSLEDQKIIVGENYKDADSCKLTSKAAVRELEFVVAKNYLAIALIICALALSAFWIFDFLQMHLTF